jgi:ADP-ribose pyrophosphatase
MARTNKKDRLGRGKLSPNLDLKRETRVYEGYLTVDELLLSHRLTNGGWSEDLVRYVVERPDGVCAVVHNTERDVCYFVKQFRAGVFNKESAWLNELAAGLVDDGEPRDNAIRREIMEELGIRARELHYVYRMFTSPGIISERVHLYYVPVTDADIVGKGGGASHEGEDVEVVSIPCFELEELLKDDAFIDAKTICGVQYFLSIYQPPEEKG